MEKIGKKIERKPAKRITKGIDNELLMGDNETLFKGWQLCPKCQGEGIVPCIGMSTQSYRQCPVCSGGKVIDVLTGTPRVGY